MHTSSAALVHDFAVCCYFAAHSTCDGNTAAFFFFFHFLPTLAQASFIYAHLTCKIEQKGFISASQLTRQVQTTHDCKCDVIIAVIKVILDPDAECHLLSFN